MASYCYYRDGIRSPLAISDLLKNVPASPPNGWPVYNNCLLTRVPKDQGQPAPGEGSIN